MMQGAHTMRFCLRVTQVPSPPCRTSSTCITSAASHDTASAQRVFELPMNQPEKASHGLLPHCRSQNVSKTPDQASGTPLLYCSRSKFTHLRNQARWCTGGAYTREACQHRGYSGCGIWVFQPCGPSIHQHQHLRNVTNLPDISDTN